MPLEDLDLEFEDEEELKKKKSEQLQAAGDISFTVTEPAEPARSAPNPKFASPLKTPADNNLSNLDDYRLQSPVQGSQALKIPPQKIPVSSPNEVPHTEARELFQEYKLELLVDLMSDLKLLDYQIHQLLVRMHQKSPQLKPEIMAIKKALADFIAKKRK